MDERLVDLALVICKELPRMDQKFVFDKLRNPEWNSIVAISTDHGKDSQGQVMGGCVFRKISTESA